jgi:hypothetical protein
VVVVLVLEMPDCVKVCPLGHVLSVTLGLVTVDVTNAPVPKRSAQVLLGKGAGLVPPPPPQAQSAPHKTLIRI